MPRAIAMDDDDPLVRVRGGPRRAVLSSRIRVPVPVVDQRRRAVGEEARRTDDLAWGCATFGCAEPFASLPYDATKRCGSEERGMELGIIERALFNEAHQTWCRPS